MFRIPPALFYTFLKIEINHWEILETVWSKISSLCNDMAWGSNWTWALTILRLLLQYTPIVPRSYQLLRDSNKCKEFVLHKIMVYRIEPILAQNQFLVHFFKNKIAFSGKVVQSKSIYTKNPINAKNSSRIKWFLHLLVRLIFVGKNT